MIQLNEEHLQAIYTHAESNYPEECCGVLLGYFDVETKTVIKIIPTENAWNQDSASYLEDIVTEYGKRKRYAIAPQSLLQIQKQARDESLNIIGIFHSHPDNSAIPSECDRKLAFPEYSYIITSVTSSKVIDIKSWVLDDSHQFQEERIQKREASKGKRGKK
jgi:proteasome lid subunit RPN8/RPN11